MPSGRIVEERVGRIIAYMLDAQLRPHDRVGRQGAYDFQLLLDDEVAALEVTTCVDADLIRFDQALSRQGDEITAPMLSRCWELWIDAKACPPPIPKSYAALKRRVEDHAPGLLSALEAQGVTYFEQPEYGRTPPEIKALVSLGIEFGGYSSEQVPGGLIRLLPPGGGGPIGPSRIIDAALAAVDDNRDKLRRAGTTERHLAVWIDGSAFLTWMGLDSGPPTERPELSEEVTTLWCVGRAARREDTYVVWRYTPPHLWQECFVTHEELGER